MLWTKNHLSQLRSDENILGLGQFEGGQPSHGQDGHRGQHGDGQVDVDELAEGECAYDAGHSRHGRNEAVPGGAAGRVTSAECGDVTVRGMTSFGNGDAIGRGELRRRWGMVGQ